MQRIIDRGALDGTTLRFDDEELEHRYQAEEGARGLTAFRITAAGGVILWTLAAILIPFGTSIPVRSAWLTAGSMAGANLFCFLLHRRATTLDRQHLILALLTTANGLILIWLAVIGDVLPGYAVGAIGLLFVLGFISRTGFVFAAMRTAVIAAGFLTAAATYRGQRDLLIDVFLLVAISAGSLLGLRRLERDRRVVFHQALVIAEQSAEIQREQEETERLLLNILPASVSRRLRSGESPIADSYSSVSVLFADIVGFTPLAAAMRPTEVIEFLSELFVSFDGLVEERGLEKIKTIGDAYMAVGGLPDPLEGHAVRVVDLGIEMIRALSNRRDGPSLSLRIGVHSGPVAGGVIGRRRFAYDVWGDTVNLASRLEQQGVAGRVHVSEATGALIAERFTVQPRGPVELRGHGAMNTFFVVDATAV
ncbi:MAG TPA: adenylate/guanylate cyclase domain-containing protein [Acidimicrobiia bacterium]|nr:adenylate/guanylate cyclase domain-containing protein [Acidimicrobiia bacterium]